MTKKRSIYLIIFLSILLFVGAVFSFVSFTYPFAIKGNYYHYSCFVDELVLGADVSDGVAITYRAELPEGESSNNFDTYMSNTVAGLKNILSTAGYKDSSVTIAGDDEICVRVGNVPSHEDKQGVINLIGTPKTLVFSKNSDGAEDSSNVNSKSIASVKVVSQVSTVEVYGVEVKFTQGGKEKFLSLLNSIGNGNTMYIVLSSAISMEVSDELIATVEETGALPLYSDNISTKADAESLANQLLVGILDMDLTQLESVDISAGLGNRIGMWIAIAMIVLVVASFAYLVFQFRELGGMAIFNTLFYIIISLGLLQAIPFVHINFSGILAIALCFCISISSLVSVCNQAKEEYKTGKKLHTCLKLAQKKTLSKILISNIMIFVVGSICALMPSMSIQSFGMVCLILSIVNIFTTLVLFRVMLKLYSALNFNKGSRCNFKVEGGVKNVK